VAPIPEHDPPDWNGMALPLTAALVPPATPLPVLDIAFGNWVAADPKPGDRGTSSDGRAALVPAQKPALQGHGREFLLRELVG
jgi:hypothetical protein